jgi:hypothetical protein
VGSQRRTGNFWCVKTAAGGHEMKDVCGGVCSRVYIGAWEQREGVFLNNLLPGE